MAVHTLMVEHRQVDTATDDDQGLPQADARQRNTLHQYIGDIIDGTIALRVHAHGGEHHKQQPADGQHTAELGGGGKFAVDPFQLFHKPTPPSCRWRPS